MLSLREIAASRERIDQFARSFEQIARQFAEVDKRFDRLHAEMLAMERRIELKLTVRMGAFLAVAVGVTATLVRLLGG